MKIFLIEKTSFNIIFALTIVSCELALFIDIIGINVW